MKDNLKIVAVIVSYNAMRWCERCLKSLRESSVKIQTIVVDNASTDGTIDYIQQNYTEVEVIATGTNLGFAKANNIGIQKALAHEADYIFLLNQDAWVEKDTICKLLESFEENENVGIVSPVHLNGNKSALDFGFVRYVPAEFGSDLYMHTLHKYYEMEFVNAAAWLVSADCVKNVGGFDTLLFTHYGEDNNYLQRVRYHGFKVLLNTGTTICHDREFRKKIESEYRNQNFAKENARLQMKIDMGNINVNINFETQIYMRKRKIFKSMLLMRWNRMREYQEELDLIKHIQQSRETNCKRGLAWLS